MPGFRTACLISITLTAAAQPLEIPKGAHVLLRMVNSISSRTANEGDYVYLKTASPIAAGGRILVPADSYVQGVVARARRSGRVAGRAELSIRLETLTLAGGRVVKFNPKVVSVDSDETGQKVKGHEGEIEQGSTKGQDLQRVAIIAGSGAGIGGMAARDWRGAGIGGSIGAAVGLATVVLGRGKEVDLKQGTSLDVAFDRAITLE